MNIEKYNQFISALNKEFKDDCIILILQLLDEGVCLREVYEDYLIPGLANYNCDDEFEEICIWKEHTRTSIIRTILEATYPYLIKQKETPIGKTVVVACPEQEYHEIGAIIATNYFTMLGFDAKYIGANTPSEEIISAVRIMNPDFLALSITNYYNIVVTKRLTQKLKNQFQDLKIIIGGLATQNENTRKQIEYDYLLLSYDDILKFKEEIK